MQLNPGAEFFESRLQRAQAVLSCGHSAPEVAAFIESVQLLQGVCEQLPLAEDRRPALPPTPATRQLLLGAMLAAARAHWISPYMPVSDCQYEKHLVAYIGQQEVQGGGFGVLAGDHTSESPYMNGSHGGAQQDISWQLETLLGDFWALRLAAPDPALDVPLERRACQEFDWLTDPSNEQALCRLLQQLASSSPGGSSSSPDSAGDSSSSSQEPLASLQRLQYDCARVLLHHAINLNREGWQHNPALSQGQQQSTTGAAVACRDGSRAAAAGCSAHPMTPQPAPVPVPERALPGTVVDRCRQVLVRLGPEDPCTWFLLADLQQSQWQRLPPWLPASV